MTDPTDLTRRTILTLGSVGAAGGALALAGCAADAPSDTASPTATPTPSVTDEATPNPSAGPDAPALGEDIAALADVPVGGSIQVKLGDAPIFVVQPTAGAVVAFSAVCTHQACPLPTATSGTTVQCNCHSSRFDLTTGAVLNGPAIDPLPEIPVAVSGDRIVAAS